MLKITIKRPRYDSYNDIPNEYKYLRNKYNWDENESIFFARELEYIKAKTYDIKYPQLKARSVIPLNLEANPGAETITYRQYDQVGMGKIIANYADDLPRADVGGKEFHSPVKTIGISYGYNIDEVMAVRMTGKPLEQKRASAAKRGNLIIENTIGFFGDTEHNLGGMLNNSNVTVMSIPNDGTGNSKKFTTKTADQIQRDINSISRQVFTVSKGREYIDTVLLPLASWELIHNARLPNTRASVLDWIIDKSPHIKRIGWLNELETAGAGDTTRMVGYRYDVDALSLEIPLDFSQLPVEPKNLEFLINTHQRCGGTIVYYPLSMIYADGI